MARHKTSQAFVTLQNKGSFPWQPAEGLVMDNKVLAWAELGITAQKRSCAIASLKGFPPPQSPY